MLVKKFQEVYNIFKMNFYSSLCQNSDELSMQEAFSLDVIHMLGTPTILEFANYMGISQPNATYKINQMIQKGFLLKKACINDKRSFRLEVTEKFLELYRMNDQFIEKSLNVMKNEFDENTLKNLESMLTSLKEKLSFKGENKND